MLLILVLKALQQKRAKILHNKNNCKRYFRIYFKFACRTSEMTEKSE